MAGQTDEAIGFPSGLERDHQLQMTDCFVEIALVVVVVVVLRASY